MSIKEDIVEAAKLLGFSRAEINQPFDRDSYLRARKIARDLFRVVYQTLNNSEFAKNEQGRHDP